MATMGMGDPLGIFRQSSSQSSAGFYQFFPGQPGAAGGWRKLAVGLLRQLIGGQGSV